MVSPEKGRRMGRHVADDPQEKTEKEREREEGKRQVRRITDRPCGHRHLPELHTAQQDATGW